MIIDEAKLNAHSLADLIVIDGYVKNWIEWLEIQHTEHHTNLITDYYGPISCRLTSEIGFRLADVFTKTKMVWQYSTRQEPELWHDATDSEYNIGKHLAKWNWRQVEK